jgi:HK97 gp10 family phage protein
MTVTIKLQGIGDVERAFKALEEEIGDKAARSKVLIPAVRDAMRPVLAAAQAKAPMDTGGLKLSLQLEARRPTKKDRRSKYVTETDTVIAAVTTASGKKLKQMSQGKGLKTARRRLVKMGMNADQASQFTGIQSDARTIAQEFGTAQHGAQPYLRPALESLAQSTISTLSAKLAQHIEKFRKR